MLLDLLLDILLGVFIAACITALIAIITCCFDDYIDREYSNRIVQLYKTPIKKYRGRFR